MAYQRKTQDEWQVHGFYGHACGWEEVTCADNWPEARDLLHDYRENEPATRFKLVCKRVSLPR